MNFGHNKIFENISEKLGFLFSYFLFTTILFVIFSFFQKIPPSWNYSHFMIITIGIVLLGKALRGVLK
jgi:cell division protein FtsW (lipid II flippase)